MSFRDATLAERQARDGILPFSDLVAGADTADQGLGNTLASVLTTDAATAIDTGVTALSVGTTTTFNRAAGSFVTDGFLVGQRVTGSGFTNGGNNATFTVTAVAATVLTVDGPLVVEAAGVDERILSQVDNRFHLNDAVEGQEKTVILRAKVGTGNAVLTPTNLHSGTTLTFTAAKQSARLQFLDGAWAFLGGDATLA